MEEVDSINFIGSLLSVEWKGAQSLNVVYDCVRIYVCHMYSIYLHFAIKEFIYLLRESPSPKVLYPANVFCLINIYFAPDDI